MGCAIFTTCFEAAKPIIDADRHAKKELKKQVRGVRAVELSRAGLQRANQPGGWGLKACSAGSSD